jgi:NTE family protein
MKFFTKTILFTSIFFVSLYSQQYNDTLYLKLDYREITHPFGIRYQEPVFYPKISYALSGGGSRGIAQIGVLKALEEKGFRPDLIVATSIGSIVGGLYSLGYSVDELDSLAKIIDWQSIINISNRDDRNNLFVDQKITEDKAVFSLRLDGLTPIIPNSINDGQKLLNQLNLISFQSPIGVKTNFDELEYRFRAVCTNLATGQPFIIKEGSIPRAIRASSSVSFFLSPVEYDTLLLADGGLVANVPVSITKEISDGLVLAINSTSPLNSKDQLKYPWVLADQFVSIPMKKLNERELKMADVLVTPDIGNKNSNDFTGIDSLINEGYVAGQIAAESLFLKIDSVLYSALSLKDSVFESLFSHPDCLIAPGIISKLSGKGKIKLSDIYKQLIYLEKESDYKGINASIFKDSKGFNILKVEPIQYPVIERIITKIDGVDTNLLDILTSNYIKGKMFSPKTSINYIKEIIKHFRSGGNALFSLVNASFNENEKSLYLNFDGGRVKKIVLKGHVSTNQMVILRELPIESGDVLNVEKLKRGLDNLYSTGLFQNFTVNVIKEGKDNILEIEVNEKIPQIARLGFKVDNENAPQVNVDIRDANIFSTGSELGLIMFVSPRKFSVELESRSNRIFNTYLTYKIGLHHFQRDIFTYKETTSEDESYYTRTQFGEYRQSLIGASLWIGTQVGKFGNFIAKAKYEANKIENITANEKNAYDLPIFSINVSTTIDTKNKYPYSTEGILFHGYYETALRLFSASVGYTSFGAKFEGYLPVSSVSTLFASGEVGFADKTLPLTQQYSLGGLRSFYGMNQDEFRGRQLFKIGLDYRLKLPFKVFFDTYLSAGYNLGSIWEQEEKIKFNNLRHGVGFGVSFDTPIGPADFSLGRSFLFVKNIAGGENPITWGPTTFYFTIGYYY